MNDAVPRPSLPSPGRLIATLAGIAMLSGLLVVMAYEVTAPRIAQNRREALQKAVFDVLPGATVRSNFLVDVSGMLPLPDEDLSRANVFGGYDDEGGLIGFAIEGAARGYQDIVRVLYGYDPHREIVIGFTVLQSTETPGLGDRIAVDPAFLANFTALDVSLDETGRELRNPVETVKEGEKTEPWQIDGISGATISSVAVGNGIRESAARLLPLIRTHAGGPR